MKKGFLLFFLTFVILCSCNNKVNSMSRESKHSNPTAFGIATILRDKNNKSITLDIDTKNKWTLFAGRSVSSIDFSKSVAEGFGGGKYYVNLSDTVRYYFQLETPESKIILSDQHLPMAGGYNFRDLGGIQTKEGKFIKWGKIFRSDDLCNLTNQDLQYLSNIPIISIVDFRSQEEIDNAPDRLPSSTKGDYIYSITPGNLLDTKNIKNLSSQEMEEAMKKMNILLVTDSACINEYKKFFNLLQNEDKTPLIYHCSAGKDRTGMATALILYSLGVDEKIILDNYLLSNYYLADKYAKNISKNPNLRPLFEVKADYIMSGINQIKKDHKSVENYLTNILGVDINKMRELYLYK